MMMIMKDTIEKMKSSQIGKCKKFEHLNSQFIIFILIMFLYCLLCILLKKIKIMILFKAFEFEAYNFKDIVPPKFFVQFESFQRYLFNFNINACSWFIPYPSILLIIVNFNWAIEVSIFSSLSFTRTYDNIRQERIFKFVLNINSLNICFKNLERGFHNTFTTIQLLIKQSFENNLLDANLLVKHIQPRAKRDTPCH